MNSITKNFISASFAAIKIIIESSTTSVEDLEMMCNAPKFQKYITNIDTTYVNIEKIRVDKLTWFCAPNAKAPEKLGFIYMEVIAKDCRTGKPIPGVVFLRGNAVAIDIDVDVMTEDGLVDSSFSIFTKQIRMGSGHMETEIAAGMMDANGDILGVAVKEINEETGLVVPNIHEMTYLGEMQPSVGGTHEQISLFYWKTKISQAQFQEMKTKIYGKEDENETIQLILVPCKEKDHFIAKSGDAKAMCARFLENNL